MEGTSREQTVPLSVPTRTDTIRAFCASQLRCKCRKPLENMVPVAGIEPATFGLQNLGTALAILP